MNKLQAHIREANRREKGGKKKPKKPQKTQKNLLEKYFSTSEHQTQARSTELEEMKDFFFSLPLPPSLSLFFLNRHM